MKDYRSTEEKYEYSPIMEEVYTEMLKRKRNNRTREGIETGKEPDGKTPFFDIFINHREKPYPIKLAMAIVESWMVTEPTMHDKEVLVGFPRPMRPIHEHFSIGICRERHVLNYPAYADRKEELGALMTTMRPEFHPDEGQAADKLEREFFCTEEFPEANQLLWGALWHTGGYQGHTVPNYDILLTRGVGDVLREVRERLASEKEEKKILMYQACEIILQGFGDWMKLQATAADKKAEAESDPVLKERYLKAARNCRDIAFDAPKTYYQAAQLTFFYNLWDANDCTGRTDQYLYPFFKEALKEDKDFAEEVTASLMMKFYEHGVHNITVGGIIPETGEDAANDLTFLMLQILRRNHATHPRMSIRVNEKSDPSMLALAVQMWSEGMSDPTVASDSTIIPAFINNYGVEPKDAMNYSLLGCQELEIPGKSNFGCEDGVFNLAKVLEYTLNNGMDRYDNKAALALPLGKITDYESFDDLWNAFEKQTAFLTKRFCELCDLGQQIRAANYAKLVKTPFTEACLERGLNLDDGGAYYGYGCVETAGSSVTADSLTAIKKLVYDEKLISRETLEAALAANFEGYEKERQLLLNRAPKFGNDNEEADEMAHRVLKLFWSEIKKYKSIRGGEYSGACSLLSGGIHYGEHTWATADGRKAGEPLGNSIGPRPGADKNGLTAMLNSVSKLPLDLGVGGTTCNIVIPTSTTSTPELRKNIEDVIYTFLKNGGQLGQITTANLDDLIDAKAHPELHSDLIIRIGGFSIKFIELAEDEQDEIISRYSA